MLRDLSPCLDNDTSDLFGELMKNHSPCFIGKMAPWFFHTQDYYQNSSKNETPPISLVIYVAFTN